MTERKDKPAGSIKFENVDQYHASFTEAVQIRLKEMQDIIRQTATEAEECISYNIPTFKRNGIIVHYAAFKTHLGFYPGPEIIEFFKEELKPYKSSKGAIQFPLEKKLPAGLIKRMLKHRLIVMQNIS